MEELKLPDEVHDDPNAKELLRLWAANKKLNVRMRIGQYHDQGMDEADAWGIIISDFTRHVANALSQRYELNEEQTLAKVRDSFLSELAEPTSGIEGE